MKVLLNYIEDKGTALVLTLWLLALLSALALNFALSSRTNSAVTRNFKESVAMRALAVEAIENTVAYLLADPDPLVDYVDEDGKLRTDNERAPLANSITSGDATVELTLSAEDGRLSLSQIDEAALLRLITSQGAKDEDARVMVSSLLDWMDPDDLHRLDGAEDDHYEPLGYTTSGASLTVIDELMMIKGFEKDLVRGKDGELGLAAHLTTFAQTVNINAAPLEVLMAMGLDSVGASSIADMRARNNGLRYVPRSLSRRGTTFSNIFRIEARASKGQSPQVYHITSIVRRVAGRNSQELKTIYWKEDIETGGA